MSNFYKVFFTITFDYAEKKNKTITKFFKSDVDLGPNDFQEKVDDKNIFNLWNLLAQKKSLNELNSDDEFIDKKASNKEIKTHRIVNLKTLTEVFIKRENN